MKVVTIKGVFTANTLTTANKIKSADIFEVFANETYIKLITLLNKFIKLFKNDFCIAYKIDVISLNKN